MRKDSDDDKSPKIVDINAMLTPFKVKHSYENMTLLEDETELKTCKLLEYSYDEEDEDRKSRCWCCSCCCCLPFFCCVSKSKHKKLNMEYEKSANSVNMASKNGARLEKCSSDVSLNFCDVMVSLPSQPSSPIKSGSTFFKTRKLSPTVEVASDLESPTTPVPKSPDRSSIQQLSEVTVSNSPVSEGGDTDTVFWLKQEDFSLQGTKSEQVEKLRKRNSGKKKTKSDSMLEMKNQRNGHVTGEISSENKENSDPLIIKPQEKCKDSKGKRKTPKVSPPKSLKTSKSPPGMTRSETYELVERWKSEGCAYQTARDQFFSLFDTNIQSRIVRYFEQQRSTLVLQINVDDKMAVCTICMTARELKKLREAYEMGVLHEELVRCMDPQNVVDKMECCAIHLRTVIADEDFTLSYQELS